MQCQEIAYSLGKRLDIPTVNVDLCIVEALCVSECPAKQILTSAIDENYESTKRYAKAGSEANMAHDEGLYFIINDQFDQNTIM